MYFCAATELPQQKRHYHAQGIPSEKIPRRIIGANSGSCSYLSNQNPSAVQSPTDGQIAIHHFAESGVMELVEIILSSV